MATDLSICNTAIELVGGNSINSFEDETRESRLCNQLYVVTRDSLLQQRRWSFSLEQVQLARLAATPAKEWNYQYQLPTDILGVSKNYDVYNQWRVIGDKLYANVEEVTILYQKRVDEIVMPPSVVRALELEMAKLLSASLAQDMSMVPVWENMANDALKRARMIDSQIDPNLSIDKRAFDLTAVR